MDGTTTMRPYIQETITLEPNNGKAKPLEEKKVLMGCRMENQPAESSTSSRRSVHTYIQETIIVNPNNGKSKPLEEKNVLMRCGMENRPAESSTSSRICVLGLGQIFSSFAKQTLERLFGTCHSEKITIF